MIVGRYSRAFMKEAEDLTYDETKRKLLITYNMPERLKMKGVKDVEDAFNAQMCEAVEENEMKKKL